MFEQDKYFHENRQNPVQLSKESLEFQRICYELFKQNKDGIKLYSMIKQVYLDRTMFDPSAQNADSQALYYAGFKEAFYLIMGQAEAHERRINGA